MAGRITLKHQEVQSKGETFKNYCESLDMKKNYIKAQIEGLRDSFEGTGATRYYELHMEADNELKQLVEKLKIVSDSLFKKAAELKAADEKLSSIGR